MPDLFDNFDLSGRQLANRAVMAPMTCARAPGHVPDEQTALYYGQRAGAGLIVTEGTAISQEGVGFIDCPGLWNRAQIAGWRTVTDRVHQSSGTIFTQLWHVGRISHVSLQSDGNAPVSSTARPAPTTQPFAYDDDGKPAMVVASIPRALGTEEVWRVVEDFAQAARNAIEAGFDGIEVHGANGYLVEQFLNGAVNDRTDRYSGDTLENRTRFALEVIDACIEAVGAARVGIRLSPFGRLGDLGDFEGEEETFLHLARECSARGIAYIHLMDQASRGAPAMPDGFLGRLRAAFKGALILAGGLDLTKANDLIATGAIDLAAFGVPFIGNPDLVERYRHGWPVIEAGHETYYGGDARGYTDFPFYTRAA